eukprot:5538563-Prymnesium_polylepis.1
MLLLNIIEQRPSVRVRPASCVKITHILDEFTECAGPPPWPPPHTLDHPAPCGRTSQNGRLSCEDVLAVARTPTPRTHRITHAQ